MTISDSSKIILSFVIAFLFSSAFGKVYVPWLRRHKAGQEIRSDGPTWHNPKAGTPTMGGLMFIFAVILVCFTIGFDNILKGDISFLYILVFALAFGIIGFLDDWEKLRHKKNLGLSAKAKFALQLAFSLIFVVQMRRIGYVSNYIYIPFANFYVHISPWLYNILATFVIVGTVNAVNITDGLDGLSSCTSIPVFFFYTVMAYRWGILYNGLGMMSSAMIGGLMGFLLYNFYPAKCFMGDTGSLFMGGLIAAMAFVFDMPLVLVTLGFIFVIETLSDIIQVCYFKATHGKRIFKMAPFHHHLEMGGWTGRKWSEKEIVFLFAGIQVLMAIFSYIGVHNRF